MGKRQEEMAELIRQKKSVTFSELKENFPDVSEVTIRRDLEALDQAKLIIRVHGGAKSVDALFSVVDDRYLIRSRINIEKKRMIAQKSLSLIKENTSIYIDSGSTLTEMCRILPDKNFLIYTSSLTCATELSRLTKAMVYVLGGRLNKNSYCVNGSTCLSMIQDANFDVGLFGVTGYVSGKGFTTGIPEEYELKNAALQRSERVVILMDSTKYGVSSTFFFARPQDVDIVVSDDDLPSQAVEEFARYDIKLL